jgi:hypothetical protein
MEEELECQWCDCQIKNEREAYYIEQLAYYMCEECMTLYLNDGPIEEDDLDQIMEDLSLESK